MKEKFKKHPYLYSILGLLLFGIGLITLTLALIHCKTQWQIASEQNKLKKRGMFFSFQEIPCKTLKISPENNAETYYEKALQYVQNSVENPPFPLAESDARNEEQKQAEAESNNLEKIKKGDFKLESSANPNYLLHYRENKKTFLKILHDNQEVFQNIEKGNNYPYYKAEKYNLQMSLNPLQKPAEKKDSVALQKPTFDLFGIRKIGALYTLRAYQEIDEKQYAGAQNTISQYLKFCNNILKNPYNDGHYMVLELQAIRQSTVPLSCAAGDLLNLSGTDNNFQLLKDNMANMIETLQVNQQKALKADFIFAYCGIEQVYEQMDDAIMLLLKEKQVKAQPLIRLLIQPFIHYFKNQDKLLLLQTTNLCLDYAEGKIDCQKADEQQNQLHDNKISLAAMLAPNLRTIYQIEQTRKRWQYLHDKIN